MNASWLPDDVLDRKKYADFLTKILDDKKESFVLNINASWGEGKTFFVKKWIADLKGEQHPAIYFNAWENDFGGDPLIALLTVIEEQLSAIPKIQSAPPVKIKIKEVVSSGGKLIKSAMPILAKGLAKKFLGIDAEDLKSLKDEDKDIFADVIEAVSEEYIQSHKETLKSIDVFKAKLGQLIMEIKAIPEVVLPLYIFIDELDRCKPLYSIDVLEKLKHVFNVPGIVFIIATDTKQLGCSVRAVYGESFDGEIYLRRFFDQEYHLPDPNREAYAKLLINKSKFSDKNTPCFPDDTPCNEVVATALSFLSKVFDISLRDQEQCFARFDAIRASNPNEKLHVFYLLFLIMLHKTKSDLFDKYFVLKESEDVLASFGNEFITRFRQVPGDFFGQIPGNKLHNIYSASMFKDRDKLFNELKSLTLPMTAEGIFKQQIYRDEAKIKAYRNKVRLVGALV